MGKTMSSCTLLSLGFFLGFFFVCVCVCLCVCVVFFLCVCVFLRDGVSPLSGRYGVAFVFMKDAIQKWFGTCFVKKAFCYSACCT